MSEVYCTLSTLGDHPNPPLRKSSSKDIVDCDLSLVGYLGKAQEEGRRETSCVYSRAKRMGGVE